jgi:LDH2 family malate/lactate/ureidoglycolate dehydrogenase
MANDARARTRKPEGPSLGSRLTSWVQRQITSSPLGGLVPVQQDDVTVPAERLASQVALLLRAWGMSEDDVRIAVAMILYADLHGIDSHGVSMLPTYRTWRDSGWINCRPTIQVVRESATTALLDADGSLGHVVAHRAMRLAIEKCAGAGMATVAVRNTTHFGAAGAYAAMASERGFLGLAMTSAPSPAIVPTFGREPAFGTNPIAFAAPAGHERPFLLDMATSTVSIGKVTLAARRGGKIPRGWVLDERGRALTDARAARKSHLMTPLGDQKVTGGHKGYGLATMVEILSAVLPGSRRSRAGDANTAPAGPARIGHFFLAIDPAQFLAADSFRAGMDDLIQSLHACAPADAQHPVLVAGDPEHLAFEQRSKQGVPLSRCLVDQLRKVVHAACVPYVLESTAGGDREEAGPGTTAAACREYTSELHEREHTRAG